jgi:hypothetical protein
MDLPLTAEEEARFVELWSEHGDAILGEEIPLRIRDQKTGKLVDQSPVDPKEKTLTAAALLHFPDRESVLLLEELDFKTSGRREEPKSQIEKSLPGVPDTHAGIDLRRRGLRRLLFDALVLRSTAQEAGYTLPAGLQSPKGEFQMGEVYDPETGEFRSENIEEYIARTGGGTSGEGTDSPVLRYAQGRKQQSDERRTRTQARKQEIRTPDIESALRSHGITFFEQEDPPRLSEDRTSYCGNPIDGTAYYIVVQQSQRRVPQFVTWDQVLAESRGSLAGEPYALKQVSAKGLSTAPVAKTRYGGERYLTGKKPDADVNLFVYEVYKDQPILQPLVRAISRSGLPERKPTAKAFSRALTEVRLQEETGTEEESDVLRGQRNLYKALRFFRYLCDHVVRYGPVRDGKVTLMVLRPEFYAASKRYFKEVMFPELDAFAHRNRVASQRMRGKSRKKQARIELKEGQGKQKRDPSNTLADPEQNFSIFEGNEVVFYRWSPRSKSRREISRFSPFAFRQFITGRTGKTALQRLPGAVRETAELFMLSGGVRVMGQRRQQRLYRQPNKNVNPDRKMNFGYPDKSRDPFFSWVPATVALDVKRPMSDRSLARSTPELEAVNREIQNARIRSRELQARISMLRRQVAGPEAIKAAQADLTTHIRRSSQLLAKKQQLSRELGAAQSAGSFEEDTFAPCLSDEEKAIQRGIKLARKILQNYRSALGRVRSLFRRLDSRPGALKQQPDVLRMRYDRAAQRKVVDPRDLDDVRRAVVSLARSLASYYRFVGRLGVRAEAGDEVAEAILYGDEDLDLVGLEAALPDSVSESFSALAGRLFTLGEDIRFNDQFDDLEESEFFEQTGAAAGVLTEESYNRFRAQMMLDLGIDRLVVQEVDPQTLQELAKAMRGERVTQRVRARPVAKAIASFVLPPGSLREEAIEAALYEKGWLVRPRVEDPKGDPFLVLYGEGTETALGGVLDLFGYGAYTTAASLERDATNPARVARAMEESTETFALDPAQQADMNYVIMQTVLRIYPALRAEFGREYSKTNAAMLAGDRAVDLLFLALVYEELNGFELAGPLSPAKEEETVTPLKRAIDTLAQDNLRLLRGSAALTSTGSYSVFKTYNPVLAELTRLRWNDRVYDVFVDTPEIVNIDAVGRYGFALARTQFFALSEEIGGDEVPEEVVEEKVKKELKFALTQPVNNVYTNRFTSPRTGETREVEPEVYSMFRLVWPVTAVLEDDDEEDRIASWGGDAPDLGPENGVVPFIEHLRGEAQQAIRSVASRGFAKRLSRATAPTPRLRGGPLTRTRTRREVEASGKEALRALRAPRAAGAAPRIGDVAERTEEARTAAIVPYWQGRPVVEKAVVRQAQSRAETLREQIAELDQTIRALEKQTKKNPTRTRGRRKRRTRRRR